MVFGILSLVHANTQCLEQMTRSFFNIWPFATVNICPIPIIIIAKVGPKCCQILTNRQKNLANNLIFAKVVKFRPICSHWSGSTEASWYVFKFYFCLSTNIRQDHSSPVEAVWSIRNSLMIIKSSCPSLTWCCRSSTSWPTKWAARRPAITCTNRRSCGKSS